MLAEISEQLGVVPELLVEPGAILVSNGYVGLLGRLLRVTHRAKGTRLRGGRSDMTARHSTQTAPTLPNRSADFAR